MSTVICYKLDTPIIYNEGTKWEKSCDTFLECYVRGDKDFAQKKCDELNASATDRIYFLDEQEEMY